MTQQSIVEPNLKSNWDFAYQSIDKNTSQLFEPKLNLFRVFHISWLMVFSSWLMWSYPKVKRDLALVKCMERSIDGYNQTTLGFRVWQQSIDGNVQSTNVQTPKVEILHRNLDNRMCNRLFEVLKGTKC